MERALRQEERGIYDRLMSIQEDSHFVDTLVSTLFSGLPVLANERCGPWYRDPNQVCLYE